MTVYISICTIQSTDSLNRTVNGQSLIKLTFDLKFTRICDERCLLGAIYNIHNISVCSMSTMRSVLLKKKINENQTSTSNNAANINKLFCVVRAQVELRHWFNSL